MRLAPSTIAVFALTGLTLALASPAAARHDPVGPTTKTTAPPACGTQDLLDGKKPSLSQDVRGDVALITDGAVAPEGAQWDAPVGVTLETGAGFVAYDLGQPQTISALVLQADANDTYQVETSVDGTPASFRQLVELPNVVDQGHGLRTRTVEIPPVTVRYLRVGHGNGDGFYSIAEFAAYCKKPATFPPAFRTVEAPPARVGGESQPGVPLGSRSKHDGGSIFILVAAAAALVWLAYRTVTR